MPKVTWYIRLATIAGVGSLLSLPACASNSSNSSIGSTRPLPSRNLVLIDARTAAVSSDFPDIDGSAYGIASVGAHGWYVGGDFSHVGDIERPELAHLRKDGSLDTVFAPSLPNPDVFGLDDVLYHDGVVYAGGDFGVIAFDAKSGARLWQTGTKDRAVIALAYGGGVLYVCGNFKQIGGVARAGIAALNTSNGKPTFWRVKLSGNVGGPHTISSLAFADGTVYFAGLFFAVNGVKRDLGLAAVSARTGLPTPWAPLPRALQGSSATSTRCS